MEKVFPGIDDGPAVSGTDGGEEKPATDSAKENKHNRRRQKSPWDSRGKSLCCDVVEFTVADGHENV
ncbi:MAG: hypothetical protein LBD34_01800 [Puniceicoccales bacterium]|nr:hypothetical protein [Puniceicoccales bacterium]